MEGKGLIGERESQMKWKKRKTELLHFGAYNTPTVHCQAQQHSSKNKWQISTFSNSFIYILTAFHLLYLHLHLHLLLLLILLSQPLKQQPTKSSKVTLIQVHSIALFSLSIYICFWV